jgi:hypothetical protein
MQTKMVKFALLLLLVGPAIQSALAQAGGMNVNVPFDFVLAGRTFVAGQYIVIPAQDKVRIQNSKGQTVAIVTTDALSGPVPQRNGRVVFNCYVEQCFLSEVWVTGHNSGRGLLRSKREIELAQRQTAQQFALLGTKTPK